jgi:hypothetical protein
MSGVGSEYPFMKSGEKASKFLNPDVLNRLMGDVGRTSTFNSGGQRYNFSSSSPTALQKAFSGDPDVILVKSAYAFNLPRFAPVGIDEMSHMVVLEGNNYDDELTDDERASLESKVATTLEAPVYYCTKPSLPRHNYKFGILQQSLAPCEIGIAIVSGVTSALFSHRGAVGAFHLQEEYKRAGKQLEEMTYDENVFTPDVNSVAVINGHHAEKFIVGATSGEDYRDQYRQSETIGNASNHLFYDRPHTLIPASRLDVHDANAVIMDVQTRAAGWAAPYQSGIDAGYADFTCVNSKWVVSSSTCAPHATADVLPEHLRDSDLPCPCDDGDTVTSMACVTFGDPYKYGSTAHGQVLMSPYTGFPYSLAFSEVDAYYSCDYHSRCRYKCEDDGDGGWQWRQFAYCNPPCICPEVPVYYACNENSCPREITFSCVNTTTTETTTTDTTTSGTTTTSTCLTNPSVCNWQCKFGCATDYETGISKCGHGWFSSSGPPGTCECETPTDVCDLCNLEETIQTGLVESGNGIVPPDFAPDTLESTCMGTCTWYHNAYIGSSDRNILDNWFPVSYCTGGCSGGGQAGCMDEVGITGTLCGGCVTDTWPYQTESMCPGSAAADCGSLTQEELDDHLAANNNSSVPYVKNCVGSSGPCYETTTSTTTTTDTTTTDTTTTDTTTTDTTTTDTTTTDTTTTDTTTTDTTTTDTTTTDTTTTDTTTTSPPTCTGDCNYQCQDTGGSVYRYILISDTCSGCVGGSGSGCFNDVSPCDVSDVGGAFEFMSAPCE